MTSCTGVVLVEQIPEKLDLKRGRHFFRDMVSGMDRERPCIVLDCSRVLEMDKSALHFLLCSLEGALKCNGDVRLAGVRPHAMLALELAGIDSLFRIFDTVEEAVRSFERRVPRTLAHAGRPERSQLSENAA